MRLVRSTLARTRLPVVLALACAGVSLAVAVGSAQRAGGIAWQNGLIRDLSDRVAGYVPHAGLFDGPHNSKITWDHLLRQTRDWQGALWGSPTGPIARRDVHLARVVRPQGEGGSHVRVRRTSI